MFFFMLFGDIIFDILVDDKFHSAVYYLPILSLGAILSSLSTYVGTTFTVLKKTMIFLYSSILAAVIAVFANFMLIPIYGVMGACFAICLSQLVMFLYRWYKSYKYVNFQNRIRLTLISICSLVALMSYYIISTPYVRIIIISILLIILFILNYDISKNIWEVLLKRKSRL